MQQQTRTAHPSWWVGLDRQTLAKLAHQRAVAMSNTREGTQVDGARGLQELRGLGKQRSAMRLTGH